MNGRIAHFASCCRNCKYCSNRKTFFQRYFLCPYIPKIQFWVCRTMSNGFGSINRAASSYSQNKVCTYFQRFLHPCFCQGKSWIRLYSAQFIPLDIFLCQILLDFLQKSAFFHTSASVYQKDSASAPFFHFFSRSFFCILTENHFRRSIVCKILHRIFFLLLDNGIL